MTFSDSATVTLASQILQASFDLLGLPAVDSPQQRMHAFTHALSVVLQLQNQWERYLQQGISLSARSQSR